MSHTTSTLPAAASREHKIETSKLVVWAWTLTSLASFVMFVVFDVDVPRGDDWHTPGELLLADERGEMTFQSFFRQHNEARILFPQLLFWPIAKLTGWNSSVLHFVNWLTLCLLGWLTAKLVRKTMGDGARQWSALSALAVAPIVFAASPMHWYNMLWTIELIVFVVPLCCLVAVFYNQKEISLWARTAIASAMCIIATFSYSNGLITWAFLWPGWWLIVKEPGIPSVRRALTSLPTVAFALVGFATIGFFMHDWVAPTHHPGSFSGLAQPLTALQFMGFWAALPLVSPGVMTGAQVAPPLSHFAVLFMIGVAAIAGTAFFVLFWRHRRSLLREETRLKAYPWIILTAFGLLTCFLSAAGRSAWGATAALTERYVTSAAFLYVGLFGLLLAMLLNPGTDTVPTPQHQRASSRLTKALMLSCAVSIAGGTAVAIWMAGRDEVWSLQNRLSLQVSQELPLNPLLTRHCCSPSYMAHRYTAFRSAGFLHHFRDLNAGVRAPVAADILRGRLDASRVRNPWGLPVKGTFEAPPGNLHPVLFLLASPGLGATPSKDSLPLLVAPASCSPQLAGKTCYRFAAEFTESEWPSLPRKFWAVTVDPPTRYEVNFSGT